MGGSQPVAEMGVGVCGGRLERVAPLSRGSLTRRAGRVRSKVAHALIHFPRQNGDRMGPQRAVCCVRRMTGIAINMFYMGNGLCYMETLIFGESGACLVLPKDLPIERKRALITRLFIALSVSIFPPRCAAVDSKVDTRGIVKLLFTSFILSVL